LPIVCYLRHHPQVGQHHLSHLLVYEVVLGQQDPPPLQ
jgi:hypothetical protein